MYKMNRGAVGKCLYRGGEIVNGSIGSSLACLCRGGSRPANVGCWAADCGTRHVSAGREGTGRTHSCHRYLPRRRRRPYARPGRPSFIAVLLCLAATLGVFVSVLLFIKKKRSTIKYQASNRSCCDIEINIFVQLECQRGGEPVQRTAALESSTLHDLHNAKKYVGYRLEMDILCWGIRVGERHIQPSRVCGVSYAGVTHPYLWRIGIRWWLLPAGGPGRHPAETAKANVRGVKMFNSEAGHAATAAPASAHLSFSVVGTTRELKLLHQTIADCRGARASCLFHVVNVSRQYDKFCGARTRPSLAALGSSSSSGDGASAVLADGSGAGTGFKNPLPVLHVRDKRRLSIRRAMLPECHHYCLFGLGMNDLHLSHIHEASLMLYAANAYQRSWFVLLLQVITTIILIILKTRNNLRLGALCSSSSSSSLGFTLPYIHTHAHVWMRSDSKMARQHGISRWMDRYVFGSV
eukprot:gene7299-5141_t